VEAGGRHHTRRDSRAMAGEGAGAPVELVRSRRRGFGGTSGHWQPDTGLRLRRLDAADLVARPGRDDVGWPIGAEELERWYVHAFEAFGFSADVEPALWFGPGDPTPLAAPGGPELAMFRIAEHDVYTRRYAEVSASPRIRVALESAVTGIHTSADDARLVERLTVTTRAGRAFGVRARQVVLATGGIDNPRLLLASPGSTGAGVGNEHDNVGRWFQDHLAVDSGVLVPRPGVDLHAELFAIQRDTPRSRFQTMLWLGDRTLAEHELLNAVAWIVPVPPAYITPGVGALRRLRAGRHTAPRGPIAEPLGEMTRDAGSVGRYVADRLTGRAAAPPRLSLRYFTEQRPDRGSRVMLSDRLDPYGIPRAKVDWHVAAEDLTLIRRHQDLLAAGLEARGVATIEDRYDAATHRSPVMPMYHHMSTTRMHPDPRQGVVDPDCRVHSTHNLHVAGSSVFPTGSYVNPTLTILALAHRLARQLRGQLGR
ncbi:MAG: GMC oxidoreductase, partial [Nocardioides sp.]|uniref:GMC oxidoreductase n=1 Tax=Nocardioides sp. TaxID=35761 RepID=UPI0039E660B7